MNILALCGMGCASQGAEGTRVDGFGVFFGRGFAWEGSWVLTRRSLLFDKLVERLESGCRPGCRESQTLFAAYTYFR